MKKNTFIFVEILIECEITRKEKKGMKNTGKNGHSFKKEKKKLQRLIR